MLKIYMYNYYIYVYMCVLGNVKTIYDNKLSHWNFNSIGR
jgi:hypothetical protein